MALAGDLERERTVASLRRHFVEGRLSVEELGARAELALGARSRSELRTALRDLQKPWDDGVERIASAAAAARRGLRVVALLFLAGVWAVMTLRARDRLRRGYRGVRIVACDRGCLWARVGGHQHDALAVIAPAALTDTVERIVL